MMCALLDLIGSVAKPLFDNSHARTGGWAVIFPPNLSQKDLPTITDQHFDRQTLRCDHPIYRKFAVHDAFEMTGYTVMHLPPLLDEFDLGSNW